MTHEAIVHILCFYGSENKMKPKANQKPGMVAGRFWVQGQPELYSVILSSAKQNKLLGLHNPETRHLKHTILFVG